MMDGVIVVKSGHAKGFARQRWESFRVAINLKDYICSMSRNYKFKIHLQQCQKL